MTNPRISLCVGAIALLWFAWPTSTPAQPVITLQISPGGLSFRHASMPNFSHQALAFGWKDGSHLAQSGKEALAALAVDLMMQGPTGSTASAIHEDMRDLDAGFSLRVMANLTVGL